MGRSRSAGLLFRLGGRFFGQSLQGQAGNFQHGLVLPGALGARSQMLLNFGSLGQELRGDCRGG